MTTTAQADIRTVAVQLMQDNLEAEPAIQAAYLFPSETEIRLVYLDPTTTPSRDARQFAPFYFGPDTAGGIPFVSAIALIRPEEKSVLQPPDAWGGWEQAELLWEA